jgi:hypothetical protein
MALPDVGDHPRQLENLRVGGGFGSSPDGGADLDHAGNIAADGDLTVGGGVSVGGRLNLGAPATLGIVGGVITITASHHRVDTEGLASADDLDTINGGSPGDLLALRSVNSGRVVTLRHGTGNLHLGADYVLDSSNRMLLLLCQDSGWKALSLLD